MNRRALIGAIAASAALPLLNRVAAAQTPPKTRKVVFVHGLFAVGSTGGQYLPTSPSYFIGSLARSSATISAAACRALSAWSGGKLMAPTLA